MTLLTHVVFQLMSVLTTPAYPMTSFEVEYYPKVISYGDSLYIKVCTTNTHEKTAYISDTFSVENNDVLCINFILENQRKKLNFPLLVRGSWDEKDRGLSYISLQSDAKRVIGGVSFAVPALEDIDDLFWGEILNGNENTEHKLVLKTIINTKNATDEWGKGEVHATVTVEVPITFKLRGKKEMDLLKKWHQDTPPDFFPTVNGARKSLPPRKVLFNKLEQVEHNGRIFKYDGFTTEYPGTPNWPKTLEQWQELEETFKEGTLHDELRLKRMMFQYKEKDAKVLAELKTWFKDMNEIQRSVMVRNIKKVVEDSRIDKGFYEAVKEFE